MINEEFEKILSRRLGLITTTLSKKAGEYASDQDRLYNFKVAAQMDKESPAKALWGMLKKHLVCVMDMKDGKVVITDEMIDEKIGDCINYLILLEAILKEKPDR